ncbi:MAG TPA: hypothetical protein DCS07_08755, partial [Bdellovibrionales bacterium]|nr:hypothetical protein [Bdellovibrionales bacterium]
MRKLELKAWEFTAVLLAAIIFIAAVGAYIAEIPLRNLVLAPEGEGKREAVGKVSAKKGELRREIHGDPEFRKVEALEPIYNLDTVVTAADSEATIELEDGATIELSPSSMVQIKFDSEWSLSGIVRHAAVEVVSGRVTGRAKNRALVIRSGKEVIAIAKNPVRELKPRAIVIR